MAKCDLSIELDDPQAVHAGGGTIAGVVRVRVDADVHCKSLQVESGWKTHGRGNVASETCESVSLFSGAWIAGENQEYRFELPIAQWPPTYHGHYLNIDHYVDARARIPWAFDPKASEPFRMRPTCSPEEVSEQKQVTEVKGVLGCIVAALAGGFVIAFFIMMANIGPFAFFLLILPLAGFAFWFVRVFLPRYLLGEVKCALGSEVVAPSESVTGELIIHPRKNVSINGVTLNFTAREQCVSGSGSNRTTHKHVFYERLETLQQSTTLTAGREHRFPFAVTLPDDAPYSVDLDDNNLIWSTTLRVDIPRWPDWVKTMPLAVLPSAECSDLGAVDPDPLRGNAARGGELAGQSTGGNDQETDKATDGITFGETAGHLWGVRGDREQLRTLVEAISGLSFELEAIVERRLLYGGDNDPHFYKDGYAVWARYTDPELPMVLYAPHEMADDFEQIGRELWRGRGTVVGWDSLHGRLQVKLDRPR